MHLILGQTHYEIGALVLQKWQLPTIYQTIVKEFRQSSFKGKEKHLILLLELSHWISGYIDNERLEEMPDFSYLLNKLTLSTELLENVVSDVVESKNNIKELAKVIGG